MDEIVVTLPKEEIKKMRYANDVEFNQYLLQKLRALQLETEYMHLDLLKRKIESSRKSIEIMREEIPQLREFYKSALADREKINYWIKVLNKENDIFLEMVKNGKDSD